MEDVPAGHSQLGFDVERAAHLDARLAVAVGEDAVGDRLGEHAVERAQRRRERRAARPLRIGGEQPRGHVQREQRQRVRPGGAQLRAEDARVGQRVAVALTRRQLGQQPGGGLLVGALQLLGALVDVEGAGERVLGGDALVLQARQPREHQVDLQL